MDKENSFKGFTNLYEVRKTVRFGLTQPNKKGELKTHLEFDDLINKSFENIKKDVKSRDKPNFKEKELIEKINQFINGLEKQLGNWKQIYERYDVISVNKDYYKILARKAKFDAFKKDKKPQASQIKLSSLQKDNRKDNIIRYWGNIITRSDYLINIFKPKLEQYLNAVNNPNNSSHTKPDLIDFRKVFLQFLKVNEEYLQPLFDKSIQFETGKKENSEEIKKINTFSGDENNKEINYLIDLGKEIREYFEANGSQVPYGKVSLNYYTALQKPNNFGEDIRKGVENLGIIKFLNKSEEDIKNYLKQNSKEKINLLNNAKNHYFIELIHLFKPKTIPFSVKYNLAKYLEKNFNLKYEDILNKFDLLGKSVDIGKDYLECKEKEKFSLEKYPIKSAFDYSWENLARNLKRDVDFPKSVCEKFLKDNFDIIINNSSFNLYANLLFIAENLATIEYGNPNNENEIIESIKNTFDDIKFESNKQEYDGYKKEILNILNQEKSKRNYKNILTAKQRLGLLRGQQKNKISKYYNLTQSFKKIASFIGKTLATIREGLKEENELNKITDYGIIIEDKNQDKYILTLKLDGKDIREKIKSKLWDGEYKVFEINSFTSRALNKFIKNPLGEDSKKFHGDYKYKHKEVSIYKDVKWIGYKEEFLIHLKDSLVNSQIAKEQNWKAFGWNFDNFNTYEKIEKEIDKKGYKLIKNSISKENLEYLINEEKCLLFPLINQDISSKKEQNKNEFTKDFNKAFLGIGYRIHPEFSIFYRQPDEENKKINKSGIINRFGRLQLLANIGIEYIPQNNDYKTRKEQNKISLDQTNQNELVQNFNKEKVNKYFDSLDDYYIFGIDRGIKQLATLCITNKNGIIQSYEIYTKYFNNNSKKWEYKKNRIEGILDLTNLKIESDKDGNKFLVDLSLFEAKDENGNSTGTNKQNIKLKQLAYIRKLQYQMSSNEKGVLNFLKKYQTKEERQNNIKELITPYKEGHHFEDLPVNIFEEMFENYEKLKNDKTLSEIEKQNLMKLTIELDSSEDLKKGVIANMIGVIVYLMKKYDYKVKIAVENLNQSFMGQNDGLNNSYISIKTNFKDQENGALAGMGTYHFFENQLLRKLYKVSVEEGILHLVPFFNSLDNVNKLNFEKEKILWVQTENYRKFGIVSFVRPHNTSKRCPICKSINVKRKDNITTCSDCGFITGKDNNIVIKKYKKEGLNLDLIKNGDDNGAYNICCKIGL
ncbi:MAG: hypothetical protein PHI37_04370 [Candidatus Gracilibacteria bacterium]|nr:hypothetical protein [Candidatus Gracilibacteria bacterium]